MKELPVDTKTTKSVSVGTTKIPQQTTGTILSTTTTVTAQEDVDLMDYFTVYPYSAIQMSGSNYFINYNTTIGSSLQAVAHWCYFGDETCVSFDYDPESGDAYLHRVGKECASKAGGTYIDGSSQAMFFEIDPVYRKGVREVTDPPCANVDEQGGYSSGSDLGSGAIVAIGVFGALAAGLFTTVVAVYISQYCVQQQDMARVIQPLPDDEQVVDGQLVVDAPPLG